MQINKTRATVSFFKEPQNWTVSFQPLTLGRIAVQTVSLEQRSWKLSICLEGYYDTTDQLAERKRKSFGRLWRPTFKVCLDERNASWTVIQNFYSKTYTPEQFLLARKLAEISVLVAISGCVIFLAIFARSLLPREFTNTRRNNPGRTSLESLRLLRNIWWKILALEFDGTRLAGVIYRRLIINKKSPRPLAAMGEKRGGVRSEFRARSAPKQRKEREAERVSDEEREWVEEGGVSRGRRRPDLILISDAFSAWDDFSKSRPSFPYLCHVAAS